MALGKCDPPSLSGSIACPWWGRGQAWGEAHLASFLRPSSGPSFPCPPSLPPVLLSAPSLCPVRPFSTRSLHPSTFTSSFPPSPLFHLSFHFPAPLPPSFHPPISTSLFSSLAPRPPNIAGLRASVRGQGLGGGSNTALPPHAGPPQLGAQRGTRCLGCP